MFDYSGSAEQCRWARADGGGPRLPRQCTSVLCATECDVVARSVDGRRLLIGEAKSMSRPLSAAALKFRPSPPAIPGVAELEIVPVVFAPLGAADPAVDTGVHVIEARTVFNVLG